MTGPGLVGLAEELADALRDSGSVGAGRMVRTDVLLGPLCTYRVGGPAAVFLEPADEAALAVAAGVLAGRGVPVLVVGAGSNLLVAEAGFAGVVVHLGAAFEAVDLPRRAPGSERVEVRVGGAALLPRVARRLAAAGLTGFEWAVGVPGSMGGAVRMNAGGHGSETAAALVGVRVVSLVTGETVAMTAGELGLGYRCSDLGAGDVVVEATLALRPGDPEAAREELDAIVRWRREHQPGGQNAGSVFTNPAGDSAGRLIEAAGAKGLRVGSAEVSTKHANFIQADADGSADDVFALMVEVARRVEEHAGVRLHPETVLVGFPPFAAAVAGVSS